LPKKQVTKSIRFLGKNGFVFPEFYGSYWVSIAPELWKSAAKEKLPCGTLLLDHLKSKGIEELGELVEDDRGFFKPATVDCFYAHVRRIEIWLWTKKFYRYASWRKRWYDDYLDSKDRSFTSLTDFRYKGEMRRTEVINIPIQGSAFHCLLWSLIKIQDWLTRNKMKTKIIGEIHDSILFNFVPGELVSVLRKTREVMTVDVRKHWPWIITPLAVEAEVAPPGKSWDEKVSMCMNCGATGFNPGKKIGTCEFCDGTVGGQ
jgi:hypothetical protein